MTTPVTRIGLLPPGSEKPPQIDRDGTDGILGNVTPRDQSEFWFARKMPKTPAQVREVLYSALRAAIKATFKTQAKYADAVGMSNAEVSLRVRHADDNKGYQQCATFEMASNLAHLPGGVEAFFDAAVSALGGRIVWSEEPTPEQKVAAMRQWMTPDARRAAEEQMGWPKGCLDR